KKARWVWQRSTKTSQQRQLTDFYKSPILARLSEIRNGSRSCRGPRLRIKKGGVMSKRAILRFALVCLVLCPGVSLFDQDTGLISGTVTDTSGAVIPGATLTI